MKSSGGGRLRIAVLNNAVPFIWGGAEALAENLNRELTLRGHDVEVFRYPLTWGSPTDVQRALVAAQLLEVPDADIVIPLKFPVYGIPHPHRRIWLLHQFRQVYDFRGTPHQGYPPGPEYERLCATIEAFDQENLRNADKIFCNAHVTQRRLAQFSNIGSEVLVCPVNSPERFQSGAYEDFYLAAGRIDSAKRQHDVLAAYLASTCSTRLVIMGPPQLPSDAERLVDAVRSHPRGHMVDLRLRFVDEEEKLDLFSRARAVVYAPVDEDSYGYVAMEAAQSRRAVITSSDSGGVADFVNSEVSGLVAASVTDGLSEAFVTLDDPGLAEQMGQASRQRLDDLGLSWGATLDRLLA